MKTVIIALCLFSAAFALTDQEKLAEFIEGLDFGIGDPNLNFISKEGALSLIQSVNGFADDSSDEFKALEHELLNGLAYAPTLEIAIAHIRILCDILHTQILDKYLARSGASLTKWNQHIDSLFSVNEFHLTQQQAILYNYELLFQFQEGKYRLAGFNLGQFMRFIVASDVIQTESA